MFDWNVFGKLRFFLSPFLIKIIKRYNTGSWRNGCMYHRTKFNLDDHRINILQIVTDTYVSTRNY